MLKIYKKLLKEKSKKSYPYIKCDFCGKDTIEKKSGYWLPGFVINNKSSLDKEFLEKQFGKYKVKTYVLCIECTLRILGFEEK